MIDKSSNIDHFQTSGTVYDKRDVKVKQTAEEFAGIFIGQMMKSMRASSQAFASDYLSSSAGNMMQEMLDDKLARDISLQTNALGLGDVVANSMFNVVNLDDIYISRSIANSVQGGGENG